MKHSNIEFAFSRGQIYDKGRMYFLAYSPNEIGTRVFRWTDKWDNYHLNFDSRLLGILRGKNPMVIALGFQGQGHAAGPNGVESFYVDDSNEGPTHRGDLRCVTNIDGSLYAAGMGRQVYRSDARNAKIWTRADHGLVDHLGNSDLNGFESIDGFSNNEVYGVGLNGSVMKYDGKKWSDVDAPTSTVLHKVHCAEDGVVYIGGRNGVVGRGRGNKWEMLVDSGPVETVVDIVSFKNRVFVSTEETVYEISGDMLINLDIGADLDGCRYMDCYDGIVCFIGLKNIVIFNGKEVNELPGAW